MPSSISPRGSFDQGRELLALWAGIAAGPLAWAVQLQANYVLSYVACEQRQSWPLHLVTAVALVLLAGGAVTAWRAAPALREDEHASRDGEEASVLRARFMALGGLALCAWFAIVILATEVPALLLHPCTP
jgi:hypothetical protein